MKTSSRNDKTRSGLRLIVLMALTAVCLMGSALAADVANEKALRDAFAGSGRFIKLTADITVTGNKPIVVNKAAELNLNGYTLTYEGQPNIDSTEVQPLFYVKQASQKSGSLSIHGNKKNAGNNGQKGKIIRTGLGSIVRVTQTTDKGKIELREFDIEDRALSEKPLIWIDWQNNAKKSFTMDQMNIAQTNALRPLITATPTGKNELALAITNCTLTQAFAENAQKTATILVGGQTTTLTLTNSTLKQTGAGGITEPAVIQNGANLNLVMDQNSSINQEIQTTDHRTAAIHNEEGATLSISGSGSVKTKGSAVKSNSYTAALDNHGTLGDINGGTFEADGWGAAAFHHAGQFKAGCTLSGGTFTANGTGAKVILVDGNIPEISGGIFTATGDNVSAVVMGATGTIDAISGGEFNGGGTNSYGISGNTKAIKLISNGFFQGKDADGGNTRDMAIQNCDLLNYGEGKILSADPNSDGFYEVVAGKRTVAVIQGVPALSGANSFGSLQAAVEALEKHGQGSSKDGAYIQMQGDSTEAALHVSKPVWVDLNGKTVDVTADTSTEKISCWDSTANYKNYGVGKGKITGDASAFADYVQFPGAETEKIFLLKYTDGGVTSYHRVSMSINGFQLVFNPNPDLGHFVNFLGCIKTDTVVREAIKVENTKFLLNGSQDVTDATVEPSQSEPLAFKSSYGIGGTLSEDENNQNYYKNLLGAQLQTQVGNVVMQSELRTATFLEMLDIAYKNGGLFTGDPDQPDGKTAVDNYMKALPEGNAIKAEWEKLNPPA